MSSCFAVLHFLLIFASGGINPLEFASAGFFFLTNTGPVPFQRINYAISYIGLFGV